MYFIVYFLLKGLSFLPLRILYLLSDMLYVIMFYCAGYRKEVVWNNLLIAFPEKTEAERKKIMKAFYHQFADAFAEIIKMFTWSEKEIKRRMKGDPAMVNHYAAKGQNIQLVLGHFFHWELANLSWSADFKIDCLGVYAPLRNKVMDKIVRRFRSKTGTILLPANQFKRAFMQHAKKQYLLGLVADQNPRHSENAWWLNFFGKAVPVVKGPGKAAVTPNTVVIYGDFYKVKRGYYVYELECISDSTGQYTEEALTKLIMSKIEDSIRKRPSNYLWTHRRWKHAWKKEYTSSWIDSAAVPGE